MIELAKKEPSKELKNGMTNGLQQGLSKELSKEKIREIIAKRAAKEFKEGDTATLGIGLPTEIAKYIPSSMNVMFQSENGLIGMGGNQTGENIDERITNAGGGFVEIVEGAAFYDSQLAFALMRGGHLDIAVLGALQVDKKGNIANWSIPGKFTPGMGGAMDLIVGARQVIIAMEHTSKGKAKIMNKCTLPLTAAGEADIIITERCVFNVTNKGLILEEICPYFTLEDIKTSTEADFIVSPNLKRMEI